MDREKYLKMRMDNQLGMDICYEYYLEQHPNPTIKDMQSFIQHFQPFIQMFGPDFNELIRFYDSKFNVNILRDKNNQIIKIL
jgi:hypothetical protein